MTVDVEETLRRELHAVADGVRIPPLPSLPAEPRRRARPHPLPHWQPLLAAAAVVVILAGSFLALANTRGEQHPQPTQPSPTVAKEQIPRTAPTVPYVLDRKLYVGGRQVPGTWWSVQSGAAAWLALRADNTWWWGRDAEPIAIEARLTEPPVLSPDGKYVAEVIDDHGRPMLSGFGTGFSGEGLGGVPIAEEPGDTSAVRVRAVTDDGRVIAQGPRGALLWLPLVDNSTVDLSRTAPGRQILGGTPAGLIVNDGADGAVDATTGEPYLAKLSDSGGLTRIGPLPTHDDLLISPGGKWLAWTPAGTTGGEVTTVPSLDTQAVDGAQRATLSAPYGWEFQVRTWAWEDDVHLVSAVLPDGRPGTARMARCSVESDQCVLIAGR